MQFFAFFFSFKKVDFAKVEAKEIFQHLATKPDGEQI